MKKLLLPAVLLVAAAFGSAFPADQSARIQELIGRLSGFDFPSINAASDELIEIGPPAVPALREALKSQDPGERKGAAAVLGKMKALQALDEIGALVGDQEYWVARGAIYSLKDMESPDAVPYFRKGLKHYNPKVRETAVWTLREVKDTGAVPALTERMLADSDQYVRWSALKALAEIEPGSEVAALKQALADKNAAVAARRNAAEFLGVLGEATARDLLLGALQDPDAGVRWRALESLGSLRDPSVRAAVEPLLRDRDESVRMMAVATLGELGDPAAIPALKPLVVGKGSELKKNALRALERLGGPEAVAAVQPALKDSDKLVRAQAVEVIGRIGAPADAALLGAAAEDRFPVVRVAVMLAARRLGGPESLKLLEKGGKDPDFWVKKTAEIPAPTGGKTPAAP